MANGLRSKNETGCGAAMSIKLLSILLSLTAIFAMALSIFELRQTAAHAGQLYALERERQRCDYAIQDFMDGSDYLTTQVEQFVIKGERGYMDAYWREIYETKSRDKALETILSTKVTEAEREAALSSKDGSDSLINGEIWAMRMVSESIGLEEKAMPKDVAAYKLSARDAALDAAEKKAAAIEYVFGPEYSTAKSKIRGKVDSFRNEISNRYSEETMHALSRTQETSTYVAVGIVIFFLFLAGAIASFTGLVTLPLMAFSTELAKYEEGNPVYLRERGALEIRRFVRVFNSMSEQSEQNTKRLARLGYIDYLTDVPNRASITEYVENLITEGDAPLGVMIADIDNFKRFNDTYGHALGDKVLRQVARAFCAACPEGSGVAGRLCGEEFVAVLRGVNEEALEEAGQRILQNVRNIKNSDVDMPDEKDFKITVSVGGMLWRGEKPADFIMLLSKADKALYASKESGKDKYSFYEER